MMGNRQLSASAPVAIDRDAGGLRSLGSRGSRAELSEEGDAVTGPVVEMLSAVSGWWADRAMRAGLRGGWLNVEQAVAARPPISLDQHAAAGDWADGWALGDAYLAAQPRDARARHGRHYTPAALALRLWELARASLGLGSTPLPGMVRDPGAGCGGLLLPPLAQHLKATRHDEPRRVLEGLPAVIEGIDSDPVAVWLANVVLAAACLDLIAAVPPSRRRPFPQLVRRGDGLTTLDHPAIAVLMNPPYGRVRLSAGERSRFAHAIYGHANLYGLFMAAAVDSLSESGVLAAVVPTSFTSGRYFSSLRAHLSKQAPLQEIMFVENRAGVFTDVLQETCLATFSRSRPTRTRAWTLNGKAAAVAEVATPNGEEPWLLPRRRDDAPLASVARAMPLTLGETGWTVSTGPLVWNRRRPDLSSAPCGTSVPVLYAADIDGGTVHRDECRDAMRWLRLRDRADARVMVLAEPAILVQRTTAPEQKRRLVAAELTEEDLEEWGGRVVVENHVNVLRPRPGALLSRRVLLALLTSEVCDKVVRCISGSVAISAYELEAIPLPDAATLSKWEQRKSDDLLRLVREAYRPAR